MGVTHISTRFVAALTVVVGCMLPACARPWQKRSEAGKTEVVFEDPPAHADTPTLMILTPAMPQAKELWSSLVPAVSDRFNIVTVTVSSETSAQDIAHNLAAKRPVCLVIMDNRTLQLYSALQLAHPQQSYPPSVVLMTSFLGQVIGTLRNATGIAYEVPAVSSFVALREITDKPIRKIGVVHRKGFANVVAAESRLAAVEQLKLVPVAVNDEPTPMQIERALSTLVDEQKVDALWVLNDNGLLSRETIAESWLPTLRRRPVPVVVGVSALVRPDLQFGSLGVLPDHADLGMQAANMIMDLADDDWNLRAHGVELPISVRTVVDVAQMRKYFALQPGALDKIDRPLE